METYTLINRNGSRDELPFVMRKINGIHVPYVSAHITKREVDDAWTGRVIIFEPIIALFERARQLLDRPIGINSGYRTLEYQQHLRDIGMKAAADSPHTCGAALDLAIPRGMLAADLIGAFEDAAQALGFSAPRFGTRLYDYSFVHVDLVFMLFDPYIPGYLNPHPRAWCPGEEW